MATDIYIYIYICIYIYIYAALTDMSKIGRRKGCAFDTVGVFVRGILCFPTYLGKIAWNIS